MKRVILFIFSILIAQSIKTQEVDTIYYDSNWKGVHIKELASYMRIVYYAPKGSQYNDTMKDYYITGELQGEGDFPVYIDRYDDFKSKWRGQRITYYKSGEKSSESKYSESSLPEVIVNFYEDGNPQRLMTFIDGEINKVTEYYSNGNTKSQAEYQNNKINGVFYQFFEDGGKGHIETEMLDENPRYNYFTIVDQKGKRTKFDIESQDVIIEQPNISNLQSTFINGKNILYYEMNGILVGIYLSISKEMGKYYIAQIILVNHTFRPFIFNADQMTAIIIKRNKEFHCKVFSSEEYNRTVGRKLSVRSFWNALGEGLAVTNAGYSSTTSTTVNSDNKNSTGYINSTGQVNSSGIMLDNKGNSVVGISSTQGSSSTNFGGSSSYQGYSSTQTNSYDGAIAYQARQNANRNITEYNNELERYKHAIDEGYLKSNIVEPGQTISGNVNIKYEKGDDFVLLIPINNVVYKFQWEVSSKNPTIYSKEQAVSNQGVSKNNKKETDFWDPIY